MVILRNVQFTPSGNIPWDNIPSGNVPWDNIPNVHDESQTHEYQISLAHVLEYNDGQLDPDSFLDYLADKVGRQVESADIYVSVAIPFSDVVFCGGYERDNLLIDIITDNDLFNEFDYFPSYAVAEIPFSYLLEFYEEMVSPQYYDDAPDFGRWLLEEYTLDDTEQLLFSVMEKHPDFDASNAICDGAALFDEVWNRIQEYYPELFTKDAIPGDVIPRDTISEDAILAERE